MSALAPIDRTILASLESYALSRKQIEDLIKQQQPNSPTFAVESVVGRRLKRLEDLNCIKGVGDDEYNITDIGLASLQHGVRIGGLASSSR